MEKSNYQKYKYYKKMYKHLKSGAEDNVHLAEYPMGNPHLFSVKVDAPALSQDTRYFFQDGGFFELFNTLCQSIYNVRPLDATGKRVVMHGFCPDIMNEDTCHVEGWPNISGFGAGTGTPVSNPTDIPQYNQVMRGLATAIFNNFKNELLPGIRDRIRDTYGAGWNIDFRRFSFDLQVTTYNNGDPPPQHSETAHTDNWGLWCRNRGIDMGNEKPALLIGAYFLNFEPPLGLRITCNDRQTGDFSLQTNRQSPGATYVFVPNKNCTHNTKLPYDDLDRTARYWREVEANNIANGVTRSRRVMLRIHTGFHSGNW